MADKADLRFIDHASFNDFLDGGDDTFEGRDSRFLRSVNDVGLEDEVTLG